MHHGNLFARVRRENHQQMLLDAPKDNVFDGDLLIVQPKSTSEYFLSRMSLYTTYSQSIRSPMIVGIKVVTSRCVNTYFVIR